MDSEHATTKKKWYQTNAGIVLLLFAFFPVGLYLMWKHAWSRNVKWVVTTVFAVLVLVNAVTGNSSKSVAPKTASQPAEQNVAQSTATPKPTERPVEKPLLTGDEGIVNYNDDKSNCDGILVVGVTKDDLDRITQLSVAKDNVGIAELVMSGKAFSVKNCTKIKLIGATFTTREVRIMDGDHFGKSGWVPFEWVRRP